MSAPPDPEVLLRQAMRLFLLKPSIPARFEGLRRLAKLPSSVLHRWNQPEEVSPVNGWTLLFDVMTAKETEETSFREGGQTDAVQVLLDAGIAVTMALPAFLAQPAFRSTNPHHDRLFRFLLERTAEHADTNGRVVAPLLRQCALPARCPDETWRKAIQRTCDRPTPQFAAQIAAAEAKQDRKRKAAAVAAAAAKAVQCEEAASTDDEEIASEGAGPAKKPKKPSAAKAAAAAEEVEEDEDTTELRAAVRTCIIESPNVRWADVGGLDQAKSVLKETVILPTQQPQLFAGKLIAWKGILLYGPPGTGKGMLAKAVATEAKSVFFSLSSADLVSKWQGESERLVKMLFTMAREKAPAVVFIDEIDALCGNRSDGDNDSSRRIKTEIMRQMDGVGANNKGVLVLGATNTPWDLDSAIRRRFEKRIHIPLPDTRARFAMLKLKLDAKVVDSDLQKLAEDTDGFSGSDIDVFVRDALYTPLRIAGAATHFKKVQEPAGGQDHVWEPCSSDDPLAIQMSCFDVPQGKLRSSDITQAHLTSALLKAKKSVGEDDLVRFQEWTEQFGQDGVKDSPVSM